MDRLLESTRVSNVMRRRELPMAVAQPVQSAAGSTARLADARGIRIAGHARKPVMPGTLARLAANMSEGGDFAANSALSGVWPQPREFRMLRQRMLRQVPIHRQTKPASLSSGIDPRTSSLSANPAARKGRALRVSMAARFHVPKVATRKYAKPQIAPPALHWTDQEYCPQIQETQPQIRRYGVALARRPLRHLEHRGEIALGFQWPGPMVGSLAPHAGGEARRDSAIPLGREERPPLAGAFRSEVRGAGLSATFVRVKQRPAAFPTEFRVATVRFDSQFLAASSSMQEHSIQ